MAPTMLHAASDGDTHAPVKLAVMATQFDEISAKKVPKIFDEYILTAVQELGRYEVIGSDDIDSMLGFEEQKSLLGCDDISCMADIGGALGVDRLLIVKIAFIEGDFAVVSKVINIRRAKVELRSSDFISGGAKALLQAAPSLIQKLLRGGGSARFSAVDTLTSTGDIASQPSKLLLTTPTTGSTSHALQSNFRLGAKKRSSGKVLALVGLTTLGAGALMAAMYGAGEPSSEGYVGTGTAYWDGFDCYDGAPNQFDIQISDSECETANMAAILTSVSIGAAGFYLLAKGSQRVLNGRAVATTGLENSVGVDNTRTQAWLWASIGLVSPVIAGVMNNDYSNLVGYAGGITGLGLGAYLFMASMSSTRATAITPDGRSKQMLVVAPRPFSDGKGGVMPGLGMAFQF